MCSLVRRIRHQPVDFLLLNYSDQKQLTVEHIVLLQRLGETLFSSLSILSAKKEQLLIYAEVLLPALEQEDLRGMSSKSNVSTVSQGMIFWRVSIKVRQVSISIGVSFLGLRMVAAFRSKCRLVSFLSSLVVVDDVVGRLQPCVDVGLEARSDALGCVAFDFTHVWTSQPISVKTIYFIPGVCCFHFEKRKHFI